MGVHVVPLAEPEIQPPAPALARGGNPGQLELAQVPLDDHVVDKHVAESIPKNPSLHTGVHVVLVCAPSAQFPATEFAGREGRPEQEVLLQVPVVTHAPFVHVAERVPS